MFRFVLPQQSSAVTQSACWRVTGGERRHTLCVCVSARMREGEDFFFLRRGVDASDADYQKLIWLRSD